MPSHRTQHKNRICINRKQQWKNSIETIKNIRMRDGLCWARASAWAALVKLAFYRWHRVEDSVSYSLPNAEQWAIMAIDYSPICLNGESTLDFIMYCEASTDFSDASHFREGDIIHSPHWAMNRIILASTLLLLCPLSIIVVIIVDSRPPCSARLCAADTRDDDWAAPSLHNGSADIGGLYQLPFIWLRARSEGDFTQQNTM